MTNFKNSAFWFWGFIILLILNISAVSTMFYFAYKVHNHGEYYINQQNDKQSKTWNSRVKTTKKGDFRNAFWEKMDLSDEQRIFVIEQRKNHFSKMRLIRGDLQKTQTMLFEEIRKPNPDNEKVLKFKSETLNSHKEIIEETIRYYEQLKTKLSEEQMTKLNSHFAKRFHTKKKTVNKTKKQIN